MYLVFGVVFFFVKQKTADEMRISDWSSDVCSSDLPGPAGSRGRTCTGLLAGLGAMLRRRSGQRAGYRPAGRAAAPAGFRAAAGRAIGRAAWWERVGQSV